MKYTAMWDPLSRVQTEPLDDYTLVGARWLPPYPFSLPTGLWVYVGGRSWIVDVFHRTATAKSSGYTTQSVPSLALYRDSSTGAMLGLKELTQRMWENEYAESSVQFADPVIDAPSGRYLTTATAGQSIEVVAVNGDPDSAVVTIGKDAFYVRMRDGAFGTLRLGSTIADDTAETLVSSASGLERVLGVDFQVALDESPLPLIMSGAGTGTQAQQIGFLGPGGPGRATEQVTDIDYDGAVGDYYGEIWCHIPWVIADYLHSQGRYSDAKRWYEAIFDPAARNVPSANPEYKRVWQFREFRKEPVESLRTALSRKAELDAYASDPFSPHAIARLRPGAYEKAMVMQYVDNLLDWGDSLFTLFTAESINEATMLYILALDILGPRALDAGECTDELHDKSGRPIKKDYDHLAPALRAGHEFVIDAENLFVIEQLEGVPSHIDIAVGVAYSQSALEVGNGGIPTYGNGPIQPYGWQQAGASVLERVGRHAARRAPARDDARRGEWLLLSDDPGRADAHGRRGPPRSAHGRPARASRAARARRLLAARPGYAARPVSRRSPESDPGHHASGQREALAAARLEHRLLRPGQQGAPRLLGSRRGPSVQHPQLPRHRGNPPATRALRARDRPAAADQAEGGRPDPRRRPERHIRKRSALPVHVPAREGAPVRERGRELRGRSALRAREA